MVVGAFLLIPHRFAMCLLQVSSQVTTSVTAKLARCHIALRITSRTSSSLPPPPYTALVAPNREVAVPRGGGLRLNLRAPPPMLRVGSALRTALLRPLATAAPRATTLCVQRSLVSLIRRTAVVPRTPWAPASWQLPRPRSVLLLLQCDPTGSRGMAITNPSRRHGRSYPIPNGKKKVGRGPTIKTKSNRGAKQRFKLRGDGTWTHRAAGKSHLQAGLRRRSTLAKKKPRVVKLKGLIKKLHRLLPYGT